MKNDEPVVATPATTAPLHGKHIIVGITGGIAAYKAPLLVRLLIKTGAEVRCAVTEHAMQFVTPLTLETVSNNSVYSDLFDRGNTHSTEHIALKDWGDAIVVAPATANIIGKMANGIADDALSTLLLSFRKDTFVCPAMNTNMLESPAFKRNVELLRNDGVCFIESESGELACGTYGNGRMAEPEHIARTVIETLSNNKDCDNVLAGKRILITAGPTYEKIDSVRFIGNFSTGKMGFALAEELARRGCQVSLVTGPTSLTTSHPAIERIDVLSARQMFDAATHLFESCDAAILSAAVADFRPEHEADHKIKKQNDHDGMTIHLVQNPDILATLGNNKREGQYLVGFALETDNEIDNAKKKLTKKNLDFIVLNSLHDKGAGFGHDTNKVTIIDRAGTVNHCQLKSKKAVACDIADKLSEIMSA
ncbi:MAG: bifunctional phosphopantothenoylcysteine decarboxylase/phosphopantothenate--cysteine ligase CoaBC [Bacteroidales bacterium]|nr:bifunctional phosphopantothenoylcysteine decarboxylase/phosphopantothenate--cysteine ligase CoaBC [Bacteroidales bacterium]